MNIAADLIKRSRGALADAEWQTRCDLAALYRICDLYGWTDSIETHLSARIPGEPNSFLINNYGDLFGEITASGLVKMDLEGNVLTQGAAYNRAGFTIHSGIYRARPDVYCIMHTHTRPGTSISVLKKGLRPISQDALEIYDELAYHEFGKPVTGEEGEALGESSRRGDTLILRNHGLLTVGSSIPAALRRMYTLNRACEIEVLARSFEEEPTLIDPEVMDHYAESMKKRRTKADFGVAEWRAALRQIKGRGTDWQA